MDAMVTGRMPAGKKEAGALVLHDLGLTSSQAINWLWDYLIAQGKMPDGAGRAADRAQQLAGAMEYVDGFPELKVSEEFMTMGAKQIRAMRLDERYGIVDGAHELVGEKDFQ